MELKSVAGTLLEVMAKNLGVAPEEFSTIFQDQPQGVRINYYPPCPRADEVLGLSPHTDGTGLTLLLQMAKPSFQCLGTSIDVPNVQALAASIANPADVPPRYVRQEAKADPIVSDGDSELPVIDFSRLLHHRFSREESAKLHHACADWGFFQLINHGVPDQAMEKMKADIVEFFKLPTEEKKAFARLPNRLEGYGQAFVVSDDQGLDWADMLTLITRPLQSRNIDLWPAQPLTFRDSLSCYAMELRSVAGTLLEVMAKNLGIAPEEFSTIFQDQTQAVRINYYPPCPRADEVLGLSPHTDGSALTLLLQVNDVEGLQIRKGGNWFPVKPLPGALIANIGDIIEVLVFVSGVCARLPREMAKPSFQRLGTSIDVPNVQALAASIANPADVPPRYVRPEAKADPVVSDGDSELPVIDFSRLLHRRFSREESAMLHHACADWGFFQLINHGVPDRAMEKMKADIVEFFKLPLEEKKAFAQLPTSLEGYGQAFVMSDDQKLDWADMLSLITRPLHSRNIDRWPAQPLTFRESLSCYSMEMKSVAGTLLEVMAKNLGVAPEEFSTIFQDQTQAVRFNYYPPCPRADEVLGLSPHTDGSGLTLLLQVNDVEGLHIRKGGNWFPVKPLPGALIANIGDIIEVINSTQTTVCARACLARWPNRAFSVWERPLTYRTSKLLQLPSQTRLTSLLDTSGRKPRLIPSLATATASFRSSISPGSSIAVFSREESAMLHHACADWGFFQLINHGVPDRAMEKMKADIVEFFKLPLEEKKAFAQLPTSLEGYGQAFVMSDDQKLDWADMLSLITRPLHSRNIDRWPAQPLTFRVCALACFARWPNRAFSVWERPLTYRTSKLLQLPSQTRLTSLLDTSGRKPRLIPSLATATASFRSSISPGSSIAVSLGKSLLSSTMPVQTGASSRDSLSCYSMELKRVAGTLLEVMAKNLGVAPEEFSTIFQDQPQGVKINYYPPCPRADEVLGLSPHTDGTGLTLLLQVNDVEGLQIRKGGNWFPVKPLPGALIAYIGDIIEILSNGVYKSLEHRAIINPKEERGSMATLHGPREDSMVGPLTEIVKECKPKYVAMSYGEFMKTYFSTNWKGGGSWKASSYKSL
ncbi:hypothetical protein C4D60_Mb11t04210 [Musa balbisiana]|uniref:Fe2OG dioxygenase domain-containing protein n=1 Tax=Musa balbisiana TaxID=52838 RepID=A0A4S8J1M6_MUSBA|nr:hypothetical protein C4D60_Mb11t04210 [Musa balbisiana]